MPLHHIMMASHAHMTNRARTSAARQHHQHVRQQHFRNHRRRMRTILDDNSDEDSDHVSVHPSDFSGYGYYGYDTYYAQVSCPRTDNSNSNSNYSSSSNNSSSNSSDITDIYVLCGKYG